MDKNYFRKLRSRKIEVKRTLRHLENERRTVECNTAWADRAAFEARMNLLNCLTDSFLNEMGRIDDALMRRDPGRYGLCLSCHETIEVERLQVGAETEFCIDCQPVAQGAQTAKPFTLFRSLRHSTKKASPSFESFRTGPDFRKRTNG
jgi:RNA polymerase-binding transcription factor DksA